MEKKGQKRMMLVLFTILILSLVAVSVSAASMAETGKASLTAGAESFIKSTANTGSALGAKTSTGIKDTASVKSGSSTNGKTGFENTALSGLAPVFSLVDIPSFYHDNNATVIDFILFSLLFIGLSFFALLLPPDQIEHQGMF